MFFLSHFFQLLNQEHVFHLLPYYLIDLFGLHTQHIQEHVNNFHCRDNFFQLKWWVLNLIRFMIRPTGKHFLSVVGIGWSDVYLPLSIMSIIVAIGRSGVSLAFTSVQTTLMPVTSCFQPLQSGFESKA